MSRAAVVQAHTAEHTGRPDDPQAFLLGLAGHRCRLQRADGSSARLPVRRWRSPARRRDRWLLGRCTGPTIDLGCGPGRLVAALIARGVPALGVDTCPTAVQLAAANGAVVLRRDLFVPLPAEGRWHHALLADGNIGIGGDPVALLRRVRRLLAPTGTALVELAPEPGLWRGPARLVTRGGVTGTWFPWAVVGPDIIATLAHTAGMRVARTYRRTRIFAELRPAY
jgi:SAM-dependent methyltransferase